MNLCLISSLVRELLAITLAPYKRESNNILRVPGENERQYTVLLVENDSPVQHKARGTKDLHNFFVL